MRTTTLDMLYEGPALFNNKVTAGMPMNKVLDIIFAEVNGINNELELDCYNFRQELGITHECTDTTSFLCKILSELSIRSIDLQGEINTLKNSGGSGSSGSTASASDKVAVDATDNNPDFLENKLTAKQKTNLTKSNGILTINGTVPKGTLIYVDVSRYGDFEMGGSSPGLGKAGTDLEGWAIANGNNGTRNVIGRFVRGVSGTTANIGGANDVKIEAKNVPSLNFNFTATVGKALGSIKAMFKVPVATVVPSTDPGAADVLGVSSGAWGTTTVESDPINLEHTHNISFNAASSNIAQENLAILPPYIEFIPIQRIA